MNEKNKKPCLFLDRDGVIIKDVGYIKDLRQIELYENIVPIIKLARDHNYCVVVVSNQAGVAKGYFSEEDVTRINKAIEEMLNLRGVTIDKWYYCPYHPTEGIDRYKKDSDLRKPKPGMFLLASKEFAIDLNSSIMIGDKKSDIVDLEGIKCFLIQQSYSLDGVDKKIIFANHQQLLQCLKKII